VSRKFQNGLRTVAKNLTAALAGVKKQNWDEWKDSPARTQLSLYLAITQ